MKTFDPYNIPGLSTRTKSCLGNAFPSRFTKQELLSRLSSGRKIRNFGPASRREVLRWLGKPETMFSRTESLDYLRSALEDFRSAGLNGSIPTKELIGRSEIALKIIERFAAKYRARRKS